MILIHPQTTETPSPFLQEHIPPACLLSIRKSSFLQVVATAFFLGADQAAKAAKQPANLLQQFMQAIGEQNKHKIAERSSNVRRLCDKHKLLQKCLQKGETCAEAFFAEEPAAPDGLPKLIETYADYTMLDLGQEGFTDQFMRQAKRQAQRGLTGGTGTLGKSLALSLIVFAFLVLLSGLLVYFLFPDQFAELLRWLTP